VTTVRRCAPMRASAKGDLTSEFGSWGRPSNELQYGFHEMQSPLARGIWHQTAFSLALVLILAGLPADALAADRITFEMVPSAAAEECLADARAVVRVRSL
jgi:hypothetical protein